MKWRNSSGTEKKRKWHERQQTTTGVFRKWFEGESVFSCVCEALLAHTCSLDLTVLFTHFFSFLFFLEYPQPLPMPIPTWATHSKRCRIYRVPFNATPVPYKSTQPLLMLTATWPLYTRWECFLAMLYFFVVYTR